MLPTVETRRASLLERIRYAEHEFDSESQRALAGNPEAQAHVEVLTIYRQRLQRELRTFTTRFPTAVPNQQPNGETS